jgi:hypothetical protein
MDDTAGGQGVSVAGSKRFSGEGGSLPDRRRDPDEISVGEVVGAADAPHVDVSAGAGPEAPAISGSIFDALRQALLAAAFEAPAAATPQPSAAPSAARVPRPPATPAPVPIPYPNLGAQAPGAPAAAAQLEPGELAWLVNEALVEQARRHGVDLS